MPTFLLRRIAASAAVLGCLVAPSLAQTTAGTAQAGLPPLIDRELFFGNPEIAGAQISPDGQYISFIRPWQDTRNIWVKKASEPFSAARLVTAETRRPIPGYFWSRDSKYILFVQDNDGDENYNVYAVNPAAAPAAGQEAPPARNLTDAKGARALIYAVPRTLPDVLYVGLNDRDAAWHDVYRVSIATGERTLIRRNTERIAGWLFDRKGELRLATRVTESGDTEILAVEGERFRRVYGCSVLETCGPMRVHNDGKRFYAVTNAGEADLTRLALVDFATGGEELVESDPEKRVDISSPIFSDATNELLATRYEDERVRYYFRDKAFEADYTFLTGKLPGRDIGFASSTADEQRWIIGSNSDVEPGETFLFDRTTKSLTRQYRIREKLPREHLAPMKAITYKSSDGLEIPAFLTLPKGVTAKQLPLVVVPHGGPWARDTWGYASMAQFLANRGYAVLQPNFRGSTGYGKEFLNAGNNEWGGKMQDDITWGVRHLVQEGIADPKRVGIMGGSYGGYATLAGVAFTPDLYAAGVSIVGPSNLITLLESIPPYWEAIRTVFHTRMGDPRSPDGRQQLERQSPLNAADKITTPLLVIQGANDPRVKQAESDQIVIALRERGFPVEYLVAPDEGHGFARPVNNMAMFAAAEKFLASHLKARYQSDMPETVETRLKEITVDPKTVTLAPKIDAAAVGSPRPATRIETGSADYAGTIEIGGQTMAFTSVINVQEEADGWHATETARLVTGEAVETATLEKDTLSIRKRTIKQGPLEIDLTFADHKVTGTLSMAGQSKPVDVELGGPLFADGPAAHRAIAALPLADGYTTTFRNFDVRRQKATLKQAAVTAIEEVTVPAGTFKAYKVVITSAEGEAGQVTVWVATETRKVLKTTATLPLMGGATFTSELQK
jgi:dipeptidyl aminopeptidase/acylaminoacyl peptidase